MQICDHCLSTDSEGAITEVRAETKGAETGASFGEMCSACRKALFDSDWATLSKRKRKTPVKRTPPAPKPKPVAPTV